MSLRELRGVSGRGDHTLKMLGGRSRRGPEQEALEGGIRQPSDARRPLVSAPPSALSPQPPSRPPGSVSGLPAGPSQPHSGPARPRPLPTAPGRPARPSRSYKSRLRARGPGHSEQLRRGDCTARPAGPAPTRARRLRQPQHRDLGPRAGYGCARGLSAQVGTPGAPRRGGDATPRTGGGRWVSGRGRGAWAGRTAGIQCRASGAARGRAGRRRVASWEPDSASGVGAQVGQSWKIAPKRVLLQPLFLSRAECWFCCTARRAVPSLGVPCGSPSHPLLLLGAAAQAHRSRSYSVFTGEVSEVAVAAHRPLPEPPRPFRGPSPRPTPPPLLSVRSPPGPTQFCTTSLSLSQPPSSCPALVWPLRVPRSRSLPSSPTAALPEVCSSPRGRTGGSGGGGRN